MSVREATFRERGNIRRVVITALRRVRPSFNLDSDELVRVNDM